MENKCLTCGMECKGKYCCSNCWNKGNRDRTRVSEKNWAMKNHDRKLYLTNKWKNNNKDKIKEWRKVWNNNFHFDGKREQVLERDSYKCTVCGMKEDEHRKVFGVSLVIHHIDGNGSTSKVKNNELDNLKTLCLICHMKTHEPWLLLGGKK